MTDSAAKVATTTSATTAAATTTTPRSSPGDEVQPGHVELRRRRRRGGPALLGQRQRHHHQLGPGAVLPHDLGHPQVEGGLLRVRGEGVLPVLLVGEEEVSEVVPGLAGGLPGDVGEEDHVLESKIF